MANAKNSERESRVPQPPTPASGAAKPATGAAAAKPAPGPAPAKPVPPSPTPGPVAPLFRRIDWLTFLLTSVAVWIVYLITLAPELTLEDSGELVTASVYAGIPHPPGYPVWTIYSWLWTVLLPVGNYAWRVAVGEAAAGAFACGLLAFMISRGSSMFMEGIQDLKNIVGKWEGAICLICGFAAGMLMGLDGFIWKESVVVNRIAVFGLSWVMLVLLCLLRWLYAPHQLRYVYLGAFLVGICFTIHQSLAVMLLAFEVALAAGNPRLGRNAFLGNFVCYVLYMTVFAATGQHIIPQLKSDAMFVVFNLVGVGSLVAGLWLAIRTQDLHRGWLAIVIMAGLFMLGVCFYLYMPISGMTIAPMQWGYPRTVEGFVHAFLREQYEQPNPVNVLTHPGRFLGQLYRLMVGLHDEYSWVYLLFALVPFLFFFKMQKRERAWLVTITSMYLCLGVLLTIMFNPSPERASDDLLKVFFTSSHAVLGLLIGYGMALTASYMATNYQRFRSWGLLGGGVAVVLALGCLVDATGANFFGRAGWETYFGIQAPGGLGRASGGGWASSFLRGISETPHWIAQAFHKDQYGLTVFANLLLVSIAVAFVLVLLIYRKRGPLFVLLGLFVVMPLRSGLGNWFSSEQRDHWFGYWFGHDMFSPPFAGKDGKPLYPEMTKDAILFGGTDPGRFCPEYIIYSESFTPHDCQPKWDQKFDRRDVYIITQNALADHTYLNFIRSHYNRSAQIDPPFFSEFLHTSLVSPLDNLFTSWGDKVEKKRRTYTSWFEESHFTNLPSLAGKLRAHSDPLAKYIFDGLSPETQELLMAGKDDEPRLRSALTLDFNLLLERELKVGAQVTALKQARQDLNQKILEGDNSEKSKRRLQELDGEVARLAGAGSLYEPARFEQSKVPISEYLQGFIKEDPQSHTRIRLNRLLLEAAYPNEIAGSLGGVYPDREIQCPTEKDSRDQFEFYQNDVMQRWRHDSEHPNEPRQLKQGENPVPIDSAGHVTFSGQVPVMQINGLLTKVIFDHNPKSEFFVEESFPLDWMYPYETPFGVIMKINREPLQDLSDDILERDHEFWRQYAEQRFIGKVVDYNTTIPELTQWIEKTYLHHDFSGFTGDRAFIRDDDAQKSFSKLRSSIAGVYAWRLFHATESPRTGQYAPKTGERYQRLLKETNFAFMQAFAFCPYSPEAVYRYCEMLITTHRFDDAALVAQTCLKFDPYNPAIRDSLLPSIEGSRRYYESQVSSLEEDLKRSPGDIDKAINVARAYFAYFREFNRAGEILESALGRPEATATNMMSAAHAYFEMGNSAKAESLLAKATQTAPGIPEGWYDLAALRAGLGQNAQALPALKQALELSAQRLSKYTNAADLLARARTDAQLNPLRSMPEFLQLLSASNAPAPR